MSGPPQWDSRSAPAVRELATTTGGGLCVDWRIRCRRFLRNIPDLLPIGRPRSEPFRCRPLGNGLQRPRDRRGRTAQPASVAATLRLPPCACPLGLGPPSSGPSRASESPARLGPCPFNWRACRHAPHGAISLSTDRPRSLSSSPRPAPCPASSDPHPACLYAVSAGPYLRPPSSCSHASPPPRRSPSPLHDGRRLGGRHLGQHQPR